MSKLDELVAQYQAAPDSDAPRLVWADEVGGEHGELVIVQCRLASGAVTNRDEWRRLRARERELLAAKRRHVVRARRRRRIDGEFVVGLVVSLGEASAGVRRRRWRAVVRGRRRRNRN
jgi:hypothetical protein